MRRWSAKWSCFETFHSEQLTPNTDIQFTAAATHCFPTINMSLRPHPSRICLLHFMVFLLSLSYTIALPLPLTPRQDGDTYQGYDSVELVHEFEVSTKAETLGMELDSIIPK